MGREPELERLAMQGQAAVDGTRIQRDIRRAEQSPSALSWICGERRGSLERGERGVEGTA